MTLTSLEPCHHLPGGSACVRVWDQAGTGMSQHTSQHTSKRHVVGKNSVCVCVLPSWQLFAVSESVNGYGWPSTRYQAWWDLLPDLCSLASMRIHTHAELRSTGIRIQLMFIQSNTVSSQLITYWSLVRTVLASLFGAQGTPLASLFDVKGLSLF